MAAKKKEKAQKQTTQKRREQVAAYREFSERDLVKEISDRERELMNIRFRQSAGQFANSAQFKTVRRSIARAKTMLTEKRLAAAEKAAN